MNKNFSRMLSSLLPARKHTNAVLPLSSTAPGVHSSARSKPARTQLPRPSSIRGLLRWLACGSLVAAALLSKPALAADTTAPSRPISEVLQRGKDVIQAYVQLNGAIGQQLTNDGIIDVTKPPYNAKSDGSQDATIALQQALLDARDARLVTFLPIGTYKVSSQLECIQGYVSEDDDSQANPNPFGENFLRTDDFPCVLRGSTKGGRATIVLADGTTGFTDPNNAKSVIFFQAREWQTPHRISEDFSFNQMIISLDLVLGNNAGAAGIDHVAAQGSVIEDINVNANGAFAGLRGLPAAGGSASHITVNGGQYGIYAVEHQEIGGDPISGSRQSPVISHVTLNNQATNAIYYRGIGPLTIVGGVLQGPAPIRAEVLYIDDFSPIGSAQRDRGGRESGHLNIIDTVFTFTGTAPTITADQNVYFTNFHVKNAATVFQSVRPFSGAPTSTVLSGNSTGWTHIQEYVAGGIIKEGNTIDTANYPVWIGGVRVAQPVCDATCSSGVTRNAIAPGNLQSQHSWNRALAFPTWEDADVINLRAAGATGNNSTDDTAALQTAINAYPNRTLFLPKGTYKLSAPLNLKATTRLIGVGSKYSTFAPAGNAAAFINPNAALAQPLVRTDDAAAATTAIGFLQFRTLFHGATALHWRAGAESVVRDVKYVQFPWLDPVAAVRPSVLIDGSGGGRWYNTWIVDGGAQGDDFRFFLVNGTRQPLKFYMLNPEHAESEYQAEFNNVQNVDVFSMKGEVLDDPISPLLLVRDSQFFRIFGDSGNAYAAPGSALYQITNSNNFLLANIAQQIVNDPTNWSVVREVFGGTTVNTPATEWFALYKRGQPGAARGTLQFSTATGSVNETAGTAVIIVTRSGGSAGAVSVDYATSNVTAVAGSDYAAGSGTLTFADGDTTDKTITVGITNDTAVESDETFSLALSNASGASLGSPSSVTITLVSDDVASPPGRLQFGSATYNVSEGITTGIARISVTRVGGSGGALSVGYATGNGTAVAGSDYTAASGTLIFADGDSAPKTFTVPLINDTAVESTETVNLTLSSIGGSLLGTRSSAVLNLTNDDAALRFSVATYNVSEAAGTVTITVRRTGSTASSVSVSYATSNGTASVGSDYTASSGTLSFAMGQTSKTFTVPIINDTAVEPTEKVNLTLSSPSGAVLITPSSAVLNITNDDTALRFSAATYSVNEGAGTATLTVTRAGSAASAVSVNYATSNGGTALAGSDYAAPGGTLNWTMGDAAPKTFTVSITDDTLVESNETVRLTLSNPTIGAILGSPNTTVLTIVDNESKIVKTTAAPVIDGAADTVWNTANPAAITNVKDNISSGSDLSGTYKTLWDATHLYVLINVTDDLQTNDSGAATYDDDGVEIYVDANNDKLTSYGATDVQYIFSWNGTSVVTTAVVAGVNTLSFLAGVVGKGQAVAGGYVIEVKIPWSTVGQTTIAAGALVGLDAHINDDDNGGARDGKLMWKDTTDTAYLNPSVFGTLPLAP